ncbi:MULTISPECIES: hypothetical protein [Sphingobacterium]|uniref:Uncharacterized protein n=2 Tax=Sphingobacterium TaxID=28453 RepID=A0A562M6Y9_9SPHI|nr:MULTISPECIES: hypothetical protein [Sphingobacterium]MBB1643352.1 hypothetical protein [Sphingobacterium sp. UME9]QMV67641.1 hypothetical protein HS960_08235 [Sphingobacterium paramultivorum]TWI15704.1 hypothetical protein IQ31_04862 [Sphingobacterium siyangense]WET68448.1 MAG: hypothetical protein P0Y57_21670 [Sphingobacterium sp.]WSO16519.1 hypothetical protein VUL84_08210 [Sphingobacterium paramultivorum]
MNLSNEMHSFLKREGLRLFRKKVSWQTSAKYQIYADGKTKIGVAFDRIQNFIDENTNASGWSGMETIKLEERGDYIIYGFVEEVES